MPKFRTTHAILGTLSIIVEADSEGEAADAELLFKSLNNAGIQYEIERREFEVAVEVAVDTSPNGHEAPTPLGDWLRALSAEFAFWHGAGTSATTKDRLLRVAALLECQHNAIQTIMRCARGEIERPITERAPWPEAERLIELAISTAAKA